MPTPPISMIVGFHLLDKHPHLKQEDVLTLWEAAWVWVRNKVWDVHLDPPGYVPPCVEAAAVLYVQALCTDDPKRRQACLFDAHELILPYAKHA